LENFAFPPQPRATGRTEKRISQVADVTSRNRWQGIKTSIHLNDSSTSDQTTDMLYKLRTFLYSLSNNLRKIPIEEKVCVEEKVTSKRNRRSGDTKCLPSVIVLLSYYQCIESVLLQVLILPLLWSDVTEKRRIWFKFSVPVQS